MVAAETKELEFILEPVGTFRKEHSTKLGEERVNNKFREVWLAELLVSSRGAFIYHCACGGGIISSLSQISVNDPYVGCRNQTCDVGQFNIANISANEGPVAYRIYKRIKSTEIVEKQV